MHVSAHGRERVMKRSMATLARHIVVLVASSAGLLLASVGVSVSAVPVRDQAVLNQRTQTATTTVKLIEVTRGIQQNRRGIRCATTTGQRGTSRDTSQSPTPNGGDARIRQFDPAIQRAPADAATAPRAAQQRALMDGASTVTGGVESQHGVVTETRAQFERMAQGVGTAPTVTGAIDQNSAVRIQNGIAWNQGLQGANLWVQALSAGNLFSVASQSAAARTLRTGLPIQPDTLCQTGQIGRGTMDDPCRAPQSCSTTLPGATPDPACVTPRTGVDPNAIINALAHVQAQAQARSTTPALPTLSAPSLASAR
jgi:hypothetical protein